jgi:hypothetical protein
MADAAEYLIRKKLISFPDTEFQIFNAAGEPIGFSKQKAFRLKEDIRVYRDENRDEEWLVVKARSIVDFSAAYDVFLSKTGEKLGTLRRKGFSSIVRDTWDVLGPEDEPAGIIEEDSLATALLRRFIGIIPQTFHYKDAGGRTSAEFRKHFNPFVHKLSVTVDAECPLNPFVPLAAGILLIAIEGRQD